MYVSFSHSSRRNFSDWILTIIIISSRRYGKDIDLIFYFIFNVDP